MRKHIFLESIKIIYKFAALQSINVKDNSQLFTSLFLLKIKVFKDFEILIYVIKTTRNNRGNISKYKERRMRVFSKRNFVFLLWKKKVILS